LGLNIVSPVPSLFTFNLPKNEVTQLQGVAVKNAIVQLEGTKWKAEGPMLITHWGFSGPAVLRLSAFAAEWLHDKHYEYAVKVNWWNETNEEIVRLSLKEHFAASPKRKLANIPPEHLPSRLWVYLLEKAEITPDTRSVDLAKKQFNKLVNLLTNDRYEAKGKPPFKEEFVTCGGIDLSEIKTSSMALKHHPNIYAAGELLNIDGVTGGFNFQAAWSTGYLAGKLL
jgi:predicted Rossmann fold flavoprotein